MTWWVWLGVAWAVVAVTAAVVIGRSLSGSEQRDWIRRGRLERRSASRESEERFLGQRWSEAHPDLDRRRPRPTT
jgi:hypothetical protein